MGYIDRSDDGPPAKDGFADHFEWDGPRWLYYRDGWRAPIALSHDEHDRIIGLHENCTLGMVGLAVAVGLAFVFTPMPFLDRWPEQVKGAIGIISVMLLVAMMWRGLERWIMRPYGRRPPVGRQRDRDTLKRRRLAGTSWRWIGWALMAAAAMVAMDYYSQHGFGWVIGAITLVGALYEAFQKWRFERRPKRPTFP